MRNHLRKYWLAHSTLLLVMIAVAVLTVAFGGTHAKQLKLFGQKLDARGQQVYKTVTRHKVEQGQRTGSETLPRAKAEALSKLNTRTARNKTPGSFTLATPEPRVVVSYLGRNYSSRNGATPAVWIVHSTESPNTPGSPQGRRAIVAWFNNPVSQASSNYTTDADGNTTLMVPLGSKAWTQAFFNPWAISDELIGYAAQKRWPELQVQAAARLAAIDTARFGIPAQHGAVVGCRIVRPGILQHNDLGLCGGGHHDAGPHFPIAHFIALVRLYRQGAVPVKPKPKRVPCRR